jgi:AbrB family looped-hinge helix DNA binding protein
MLAALERHGVVFVAVGQLAAQWQGAEHVTRDFDICPAWHVANRGQPLRPRLRRSTLGPVRCYLTHMRTTISTKGQIVLPAEFRAADDIEAGEEFEVDRIGPDEYRMTRQTPPPDRGLVEWLRSCPDDGWFVEVESESTDSLS